MTSNEVTKIIKHLKYTISRIDHIEYCMNNDLNDCAESSIDDLKLCIAEKIEELGNSLDKEDAI